MRINVLNTFMDGRDRFTAGEVREVADDVGLRAVANGWAEDVAGRVATGKAKKGATDLAVDNSTLGVGDSNG
jgi:hypothetical protein